MDDFHLLQGTGRGVEAFGFIIITDGDIPKEYAVVFTKPGRHTHNKKKSYLENFTEGKIPSDLNVIFKPRRQWSASISTDIQEAQHQLISTLYQTNTDLLLNSATRHVT